MMNGTLAPTYLSLPNENINYFNLPIASSFTSFTFPVLTLFNVYPFATFGGSIEGSGFSAYQMLINETVATNEEHDHAVIPIAELSSSNTVPKAIVPQDSNSTYSIVTLHKQDDYLQLIGQPEDGQIGRTITNVFSGFITLEDHQFIELSDSKIMVVARCKKEGEQDAKTCYQIVDADLTPINGMESAQPITATFNGYAFKPNLLRTPEGCTVFWSERRSDDTTIVEIKAQQFNGTNPQGDTVTLITGGNNQDFTTVDLGGGLFAALWRRDNNLWWAKYQIEGDSFVETLAPRQLYALENSNQNFSAVLIKDRYLVIVSNISDAYANNYKALVTIVDTETEQLLAVRRITPDDLNELNCDVIEINAGNIVISCQRYNRIDPENNNGLTISFVDSNFEQPIVRPGVISLKQGQTNIAIDSSQFYADTLLETAQQKEKLQFMVALEAGSPFYFSNGTQTNTFTMQQIIDGEISFFAPADMPAQKVTVPVTVGNLDADNIQPPEAATSITIRLQDHAPSVINSTMNITGTFMPKFTVLTQEMLLCSGTDYDNPADILYQVDLDGVVGGEIQLKNRAGYWASHGTFTQEDVNAGRVRFYITNPTYQFNEHLINVPLRVSNPSSEAVTIQLKANVEEPASTETIAATSAQSARSSNTETIAATLAVSTSSSNNQSSFFSASSIGQQTSDRFGHSQSTTTESSSESPVESGAVAPTSFFTQSVSMATQYAWSWMTTLLNR